jgi:glutamate synthase domain-containing protein 3
MAQRPVQLQAAPAMDEEERELRYIVELIIKHLHQTITEEERKTLDEWACSSEYNKKFLEEMPQTSDIEKVYYWFVERLIKEQNKIGLN